MIRLNNRGKYFLFALAGILTLLYAPASPAATINVNPGDSLQAAIDGAGSGDTIQLATGTYRTSDDTVNDEITIDKNLTIIGAGRDAVFIQAADAKDMAGHGVFNISNADVVFRDLTIRYGQATVEYGGGILQDTGRLTLENCTVKDNSVFGYDLFGGGIYTEDTDVIIKDSVIEGNSAYVDSVYGSVGAGIAVDNGTLDMSGTVISENTSEGNAGGIFLTGTIATISHSTIEKNTADLGGGGLISSNSIISLSHCTIAKNHARAVWLGPGGGGILADESRLNIDHATISENTTDTEGGGIYNESGEITISDSVINDNHAVDNDGGGIENYDVIYISNTTIDGNSSGRSGGGIQNDFFLRLENCTISGNTAMDGGGGIRSWGGELQISNSTISGNTADTDGGGLYNQEGLSTITFTTITNNTAKNVGGGIFNDSFLTMDNTMAAQNTAQFSGAERGADYYNDSTDTVSNGGNLLGTNNGYQTVDAFPTGSPNVNGDYVGEDGDVIDPLLGPLADNGGPTMTHALSSASSPAVDAALDTISTDQRGIARPYPTRSACDIGAFEYYGSADLALTKTVNKATAVVGEQIVYTITLKNNGPDEASGVTVTESLPSGLTYLSDDAYGHFDPNTGLWSVRSLISGASVDLNITFQVDIASEVINTVTADAKTTDPTPATASAVINQSGVNDPPAADDQDVATPLNTPLDITLTANDPYGDPLTYSIVDAPQNGTLVTAALGSGGDTVRYTPNTNVGGTDRFTFKANDGTLDSNTAVVEITVGDAGQSYTLTINKDGDADGRVTALPVGIDCGGACNDTFAKGTHIMLMATPEAGAAFDGWTGGGCVGNGQCHLVLEVGQTVTATFNTDSDNDGSSNVVENAGPNNGDANKDGIADAAQSNIASLTDINGDDVYLEVPDGLSLSETKAIPNPSEDDAPGGLGFGAGFFSFKVLGLTAGDSQVVNLHLPVDASVTTYYKYGPTPDDQTDHWYEFLFDSTTGTGVTITRNDEHTVVALSLTDGGRGDSDLTADSEIFDPGGPAFDANAGNGGGGGGCSCGGSAGASVGGQSDRFDYDIGPLLAVLAGILLAALRRRWRKRRAGRY